MADLMSFVSVWLSLILHILNAHSHRSLDLAYSRGNQYPQRTDLLLTLDPKKQQERLGLKSLTPLQSDQSVLLPDLPHPLLSDPLFDSSILTDDAGRVIQSSECTPQERQNRIQCFDKLPEEKYAVSLGNTVNMQCVVLNQHGKVQWRAKKILLGECHSLSCMFYDMSFTWIYILLKRHLGQRCMWSQVLLLASDNTVNAK